MSSVTKSDILVLGGSFLGIELVRRLRLDARGRALSVRVIDRQSVHPYIPLGHELACERMPMVESRTILPTARYIESLASTSWIQGEIVGMDPSTRTVTLAGERAYQARAIVVALGSELRAPTLLPGAERLLGYKSEVDLDHAHRALEQLLGGRDGRGVAPTVLVVGGGITGVEIAGELAYLSRKRPKGWAAPKVVMVHSGSRLLPGLTERAGRKALAGLRRQGVEVLLEARLSEIVDGHARVRRVDGEERTFACELGFWAGGLQPPGVIEQLGLQRDVLGWLRVDPYLRCVDAPGVFAAGDVARIYDDPSDPSALAWPNMQRAIEAIFAAKTLARNVVATLDGEQSVADESRLRRHPLWTDFPHGVSAGACSLLVYGPIVVPTHRINTWFRRFLMRQYMRRYRVR